MIDERRIIFSNILNKVPLESISRAFNKAESDIKSDFAYITQKIKNYCFKNNIPPIFCDTIEEAQKNRHTIFEILPFIDLNKSPEFKIRYENFNGNLSTGNM